MAKTIFWVRRARENGKEENVTSQFVKNRLEDCYRDVDLVMKHASKKTPLANGLVDYYPAW